MKLILVLLTLCPLSASAIYYELGLNYSYKKSFIDSYNNIEQQGTTGSVSFYFWEQLAVEVSYTNSLLVKKEQQFANTTASTRLTSQVAKIYGLDIIYVFGGRKATFQPYLKGGVAYISKAQSIQIDNQAPSPALSYEGTAPSYGVGLKYLLGESFAIRLGYDVIQTPIDNNNTALDINGRAGISWIF